jgi:alkyl sulfatase BDS1-like metallo-beta-lactamase superfamily hydrolase
MSGKLRGTISIAVFSFGLFLGESQAAPNPATDATRKANQVIADYLQFSNTQDFDDA